MKDLAKRAIHDKRYRRYLAVKMGFAIDAVWAVANLVLGVLQASIWFITLGAYYMVFGVFLAHSSHFVVHLARHFKRRFVVSIVDVRRGRSQDGVVDTGFVHEGDMLLSTPCG